MTSLRDQLLGTNNDAVPEYSIVLPSGWTEHDASEGSEKALVDSALRRLRDQHRPELYAQIRALSARAFSGLRSADTKKIYLQTDEWANDLLLPLSLSVSVRTAPPGSTLDAQVVELIRTKGAQALHDDKRFVRWESSSTVSLGTETVGQRTVAYLTPFPSSDRTKALLFTAVAVHPLGEGDLPLIDGMFQLTDAIISTFAWHTA